jgi:hypothetical protein
MYKVTEKEYKAGVKVTDRVYCQYPLMIDNIEVLGEIYGILRDIGQVKLENIEVTPLSIEVNTDDYRATYVVERVEEE